MAIERRKLDEAELRAALAALPGWSVANGKLHRVWEFADFVEAWGFMSAAALRVQEMDHHPEWSNVYARVVVDLVTHDLKGISTWDVELAKRMEKLATRSKP